MKNSFLLAGIAALMLSACNNKPAQELTLSGKFPNRSEQCQDRSLHLEEQVGHGSVHY